MSKFFLSSKIHGMHVTDKNVAYTGSVTIDGDILDAAEIDEFEKVQLVNVSSGERFETYVLRGEDHTGSFILNGGAARLGEVGDKFIVISYCIADSAEPKLVLIEDNKISKVLDYRGNLSYLKKVDLA